MLLISFMTDPENEVGRSKCSVVPRVGETVWLSCSTRHAQTHDLDSTLASYRVTDVAYWMANTDSGLDIESHRVAVFVEPIETEG